MIVASFALKVSSPYLAAVASINGNHVRRTWTGKIVDYAGRKIGRLSLRSTLAAAEMETYGDRYWTISSNAISQTDERFGKEEQFRLELNQYEYG